MNEPIALTPADRAALERALHRLRDERLPALTRRLAEAREDGAARDEDTGLLELQEEHRRAERQALDLERVLAAARELAPPAAGTVGLGSRVEIADEGERDAFQLVDPQEADAAAGRISVASPVGRALLGHAVGDTVTVALPDGPRHLHITSVA